MDAKAVRRLIGEAHDQLKGMSRPGLCLKVGERRHDQMNSVTVGVEKTLEQRLPLAVLVEFVEQCDRRLGRPKAIPLAPSNVIATASSN